MKIAREKNKEVVRVVKRMNKIRVKVLRDNEWQVKGDLILKKEKVYIPKNEKLKVEIVQLHHDVLIAGHERR